MSVVTVAARFTTCATGFDLLGPKVESPPYAALMLSVPPVRLETAKVADPPLNGEVPSGFGPCKNVIVSPSGGAPCAEVTVAVKVTDWPYDDGSIDDEIEVVVVVSAAQALLAIPSKTTRHAIFFIRIVSPRCKTTFHLSKLKSISHPYLEDLSTLVDIVSYIDPKTRFQWAGNEQIHHQPSIPGSTRRHEPGSRDNESLRQGYKALFACQSPDLASKNGTPDTCGF